MTAVTRSLEVTSVDMCRWNSRIRRALGFFAVSAVVVLTPAIAHALDIGKLRVYSSLTSPLEAEVGLIAPAPEDLETLIARVVAPANFTGSVESLQLLSDIRVTVTKRSDESYSLRLRSTQPLTEPVLHFVLDVKWASGRSVQEFTALIDLPRSQVAETVENEKSVATDKAVLQDAEPQHAATPSSPSQPAAPVPSEVPTSQAVVDTPPLAKAQVQAIAVDKNEKPASPAASQTLAGVGEPGIEKPQEKPSAQAPAATREPEAAAARKTELASPPPEAPRPISRAAAQAARKSMSATAAARPSSSSQDLGSVVTQWLRQNPTWALTLVTGLALALLLLAVALTVLSIKLHRRHAQRGLETKLPTPKLVKPKNIAQPEALSEGNRRQRDRRQRIDRRQRSVPVAIERRTGLARRRSELADDGKTTVCVELSDPIAEAEAYMAGGFYGHAEQALEDALSRDPSRLDLKVKLLEVYDRSGNEPALRILAEELHPQLGHGGNGAHSRGANGEENVLLNDLPVPEEPEVPAVAPGRQRKKGDGYVRTAAAGSVDRHMIEWDADMEPIGSAAVVATQARHECEMEGLPYLSEATATITLEEVFSEFLRTRKKLKPSTIAGYKRLMATLLADWGEKDLLEISADLVSKRHAELSQDHGKAYANRSMRFLRTLYNFALEKYQNGSDRVTPENPVQCI